MSEALPAGDQKKRKRKVKKVVAKPVEENRQPRGYGERRVLEKLPEIPTLQFGECLGFGHFSHVYAGIYKNKYPVAIKIIERGSEKLVVKEISLLNELKGLPHIVQLYEVIHAESQLLVFELLKGMSEEAFYAGLTLERFRFVLRCLFEALRAAHEKNIVHRDVKFGNILIAEDWSDVKLIDWGCGSVISDMMSAKAGSRSVRSIEMLLGCRGYRTKCDMWAMGTFIFTVLCGGNLPWKRSTTWETVIAMAGFVGRRSTLQMAKWYESDMPEEVAEAVRNAEPQRFRSCYSPEMKHVCDKNLIDLMHKLLVMSPDTRISAEEALAHPFFAEE